MALEKGFKRGEELEFLEKKKQQFRNEEIRRGLAEQAHEERLMEKQKSVLEANIWKVPLNYLEKKTNERVQPIIYQKRWNAL